MELSGAKASLRFQSGENAGKYALVALERDVSDVLASGERIWFSGESGEEMALVTANATYELRFAENSNSLFAMDAHTPEEIVGPLDGHMEMSRTAPRTLKALGFLKRKAHYTTEDQVTSRTTRQDEHQPPGATWDELLELSQASETELQNALLNSVEVVELDLDGGHGQNETVNPRWAIACPDAVSETLSLFLDSIAISGWDLRNLPVNNVQVVEAVPECRPPFVRLVLRHFTTSTEAGSRLLDCQKVARFVAQRILQRTDSARRVRLADFTDTWLSSMPEDVRAELPQTLEGTAGLLSGLAIFEKFLGVDHIRYYPSSTLPAAPGERFKVLFATKASWSQSELLPYVQDLIPVPSCASSQQVVQARDKFLRGHCRVVKPVAGAPGLSGKQAMYSARTGAKAVSGRQ